MDTDSIKCTINADNILELHDSALGKWKNEGNPSLFKVIGPKKYAYYEDEKLLYTCAGFNKKTLKEFMLHDTEVSEDKALEMLSKFDIGLKLTNLQSKVVKGGRALLKIEKEIRV